MKIISQTFSILVGLLLLGALAFTGIAAIEYVGTLYMSIDPQLARITASVLFVVLIAAWTIAHSLRKASAQRMRQQLGDEITAAYQYFMDFWIEIIDHGHLPDSDPESQHTLDRIMALYGSTEAIKAHLALKAMMQEKDMQVADMRTQFGKALLAMRKDLGVDTQGITAQELVQLVLSEPNPEVQSTGLAQPKPDSEPASGA
jgi:hypothetical protein